MNQRANHPILSDRIDREAEILEWALNLPPSQRAEYLESTCGDDRPLRARVEAMLADSDSAADFLASPTQRPEGASRNSAPAAEPGTIIGPYRVVRMLGEGGFGTVYLAQQDEPIRRQVALKIVKAGMDTRQVLARFDAERHALSVMDHPFIARVFDAGATEAGRPYFTLEVVEGVPITRFCNEHELSLRARLDLFRKVCAAVLHAHQKGLIHRDLKPGNVLVTMVDGQPTPKVIDFGIAKAAQPSPGDQATLSGERQLIGTPEYMSPEQADLTGQRVDTRSDIYSLGVMLYELMTGTTPFDRAALRRASLEKLRHTLRDTRPTRPSARLASVATATRPPRRGASADVQTADAEHTGLPESVPVRCGMEPAALGRTLSRELDWVVMKALESDPARRYETASALADDLGRYLSGDPVQAVPPTRTYLLLKTLRRHKAAAVVIASVIIASVATTIAIGALYRGAKERTESASRQARDLRTAFSAFSALLETAELYADKDRSNIDFAVRKIDELASNIGTDYSDQAEEEAELRALLAAVYGKLGRSADTARQLSGARDAALRAYGPSDPRYAGMLEQVAGWSQDPEEKVNLIAQALNIYRDAGADGADRLVGCLVSMARFEREAGRPEQGKLYLDEALVLIQTAHADEPQLLKVIGEELSEHGQHDVARFYFDEAVRRAREADYEGSQFPLAHVLHAYGITLRKAGDLDAALAVHEEALAIRAQAVQKGRSDAYYYYVTEESLAYTLFLQGRYAEAEPLLLDAYENYDPGPLPNLDYILVEIVERLVELYERWGRQDPSKLSELPKWRVALDVLRDTQAE